MQAVAQALSTQLGVECEPAPERTVAGGSVHRCYRWGSARGALFVKVAPAEAAAQLAAEAAGLAELAEAATLRVPRVRAQGLAGQAAFLALEWIDVAAGGPESERRLGQGLARLHGVCAEHFGWQIDNTIGAMPQRNGWCSDWIEFWRERRLRPQLAWAVERGFGPLLERLGARVIEVLDELLGAHTPSPSLLHGDLWGGNWCTDTDGAPVIFDPAVYFGDRETDLAMTGLFGGFGRAFYEAYKAEWPLPAGHRVRSDLYNLYHVLNHANLFGGGYAQQARAMMGRLLAETTG